jgi:ABC-type nitrate/sulfonate/bicarbonate transport system ATPase subunit
MALVEFDRVGIVYRSANNADLHAVSDFNLDVRENEFVSIVGPSGCGKSSVLEASAALRTVTSGQIRKRGETVRDVPEGVSVVFQEDSTFAWRSTMGNVEFGLEAAGVSKSRRREAATKMIDLVGLSGFERAYPGECPAPRRRANSIRCPRRESADLGYGLDHLVTDNRLHRDADSIR